MTKSDRKRRLLSVLVASLLAATLAGTFAHAAPPRADSAPPRSELAEAWIVNTRCVSRSCPSEVDPDRFSYRFSVGTCPDWQHSDAGTFFTSPQVDTPVIVFIHGNRTDSCDAVQEGWALYQRLICDSGGHPFRFVIWSWPSEKVRGGPRKDALIKAARSDTQSFYLAAWLDRLPPETPVTLIGYSFGARVIGGALHLGEGGSLLGMAQPVSASESQRRRFRVMLVAAAIDCEWFSPGCRYGLAPQAMEQLFVTRNGCDPVLRLYPRMRRCDSSNALGFAGPASPTGLSAAGVALETVSVSSQVGKTHSWYTYLGSHGVRSRLAGYSFFLEEATAE